MLKWIDDQAIIDTVSNNRKRLKKQTAAIWI